MTVRMRPLLLATLGVACGSGMDALVKFLAQDVALMPLIGWRFIVGAFLSIIIWKVMSGRLPTAEGLRFNLMRGFLFTGVGITFFYAVTQLALSEATVLIFTAALMIPLFARGLLKEKLNPITMVATLVGFAGVALASLGGEAVGAPQDTNRALGFALGLVSAALYGLGLVLLRMRAGKEDGPTLIMFSNVVPAILLSPFAMQFSMSDVIALIGPITLAALLGVSVWWLLATAYAEAPAQQLAPLEYTGLIWATFWGWILFGERPAWTLYLGAVIVIIACLVVAFESHFETRRKTKSPASDILH